MCVSGIIKIINFKVFNIISRNNETKHIKYHETCKCICRLDAIACNNKQRWNDDKCRCEYKELIDKGICDKGFIWSHISCECEYDKSFDVGEYLDNENCKCRKKLVEKLVGKCTESMDHVKIAEMGLYERGNDFKSSCTIYVVLIAIVFTISIGIGAHFIYYKYINRDKETAYDMSIKY